MWCPPCGDHVDTVKAIVGHLVGDCIKIVYFVARLLRVIHLVAFVQCERVLFSSDS